MLRPLAALLAVLTLTVACEPTAPLADPSPNAPLVESIAEPTDGAANEIGVN